VARATFGVAALASGRRFFGVDVDPKTLAIAAERLRLSVEGECHEPEGDAS